MIESLRSKIQEWESSPRCHIIIGTGNGGTFCAGGDVKTIVQNLAKGDSSAGITFFKEEFELDYALASLKTPYVAILDGITMGGGVGLSINAMFRVATERTVFAMPETKIGYSPDVGASFFLPRLDGALGRYLGLTGETLTGREVFEAGVATHFVSSHRLPQLLDRLTSLDSPTPETINNTLEEFHSERLPEEPESKVVTGSGRTAIDRAFGSDSVEGIFKDLEKMQNDSSASEESAAWASKALATLNERSPTSLHVAFEALKRGRKTTLAQALGVELGIATAFCTGASRDFITGVSALLINKQGGRPAWDPSEIKDVKQSDVVDKFFSASSPFFKNLPTTSFTAPEAGDGPGVVTETDPLRFSLPSEEEIGRLVRGEHPSSSDTSLDLPELLERSRELYGKAGVEAKVKDVVARRCEVVAKTDNQEQYLRWKH
ncbi:hypothetical protein FRB93_012977 [Tulasnella sp. JGI-2019a]|nr:hypothetical protein FRB93_012977 [Tulasnella sp. JGI-2019a]